MSTLVHPLLTPSEFAATMDTTGAVGEVPDLVVEVLSPSTRVNDLGPKRAQYLAAGVRELWLIDPADTTVHVVTPTGEERLGAEDELSSVLLAGFALKTREIFPG